MNYYNRKQFIYNNKVYKDAGFSFADCRAFRYNDEILLIEPGGTIFFSYIRENNYAREM